MDPKILRALAWFAAAGLFIFALLNSDRESFEQRFEESEQTQNETLQP